MGLFRSFSVFLIFIGILLIVIGHYERDKRYFQSPKIIYKFINQDIGEEYARQQDSVYNQFVWMFEDRSLRSS